MHFDLLEPVLEGVEALPLIHSVGHDDPHGSLVICLCYCLEPLLPCCVPDLHPNLLAINLYGLNLEVDP